MMLMEFRQRVHIFEKSVSEGNFCFKELDSLREEYHTLYKSFSVSEIFWIKKVLFNTKNVEECKHYSYGDLQEFRKVIFSRRSERSYGDAVKKEKFNEVVSFALYAPSSCNRQSVSFLLTYNKDKIKEIAEIKKQKFIATAKSLIVVFVDMRAYNKEKGEYRKLYFALSDGASATTNLLLGLAHLDLAGCWVNVNEKNEPKIKNLFNIPDHFLITAVIPCGNHLFHSHSPGRKSIERASYFERYIDTPFDK